MSRGKRGGRGPTKARATPARPRDVSGTTRTSAGGDRTKVLTADPAPPPAAVEEPEADGDGVLRGRAAWTGAAGSAAVVILLVQLVWRSSYLSQGYFTQDDFLMLHLGGTSPMGLHYLFQDYAGHLFPGGFLIAYIEAHAAPLSWGAAYVPVLLMQAGAGVLAWMVLTRLLGARWERLPLLAVFCLSPLSLWSTQWWAVAIQLLPLELCALGAALSFLRWHQDDDVRGWRFALVLTVGGLLFEERGILIPLVVLTTASLMSPAASIKGRLTDALRSDRRLWIWMGAIVVSYLVLHQWLAPVQGTGGGGVNQSLDLVTNFFFRNAVPGVFGGPWTGVVFSGAAIIPPGWVIAVSCGLFAALVGYTARFGGSAARTVWWLLLAYAVIDAGLVFGGRAQYGSFSGLTTRYAADLLPILLITLAGAVRDVVPPPSVEQLLSRRAGFDRRTLACLVVVAYAASAALTSHLMAPVLFNTSARTYVDNLRHDLSEQPAVVLYDSTVPDDVMISWFGNDDRVSTVVGLAPWAPSFDEPSEQLRIVDGDGHLQPVVLANPVDGAPGPSTQCGYNITLNDTAVTMQSPVPLAANVLQLGYYTAVDDVAMLTVGTQTVTFPVSQGLHSVDLVLDTAFDAFALRLTQTAGTLCLVAVAAGLPQRGTP